MSIRTLVPCSIIVLFAVATIIFQTTVFAQSPTTILPKTPNKVLPSGGHSTPKLVFPSKFRIELFSDFSELPGKPKAFHLTITNGQDGFPAGMYVTSGPAPDQRSDRLFRIDGSGKVLVQKGGFKSNEDLIFAKGKYGDGMLITSPLEQQILRLAANGSISTFAKVGAAPFGPAALAFAPDGLLYTTDYSSGNILRVYPNGSSHMFASIPKLPAAIPGGSKGLIYDTSGKFGGGFMTATFTLVEKERSKVGAIYSVSNDGKNITKLAGSQDGTELLTFGPGGVFGYGLYVPSIGTDLPADGDVSIMSPDGKLTPFLTNVDATSVVFDTKGLLGGGMFVADINNTPDNQAGKIWHVVPISGLSN